MEAVYHQTAEDLRSYRLNDILILREKLDVDSTGLEDKEDTIQRILVTARKRENRSHNPFAKFVEISDEHNTKCETLQTLFQQLISSFQKINTGPLSEILIQEKLLARDSLMEELEARHNQLVHREVLIVILGETKGGKSTFLNLILLEDILPTNFLHCTIGICKLKYSETYSIETIDTNGEKHEIKCSGCADAREKLDHLVAQADMKVRDHGTGYKEVTLKMPSPILKSGVTLVDTPGFGESEEIDKVTMEYVKSIRAAGFIYIIKADAAGGVQDDRMVFLKSIQDHYNAGCVDESFDPSVALFLNNRMDEVHNIEKIKKNALTKLPIAWPGFQSEQAHFFSCLKTRLHLDIDPEFITDDFNDLLTSMKEMFTRATHNSTYQHYRWAKYFLQPASNHLRSMINHCIFSNEEQRERFTIVANKQEMLMQDVGEKTPDFEVVMNEYKNKLKQQIVDILSKIKPDHLDDFSEMVSISANDDLNNADNRKQVNQWIVASLIRYIDTAITKSGIVDDLEKTIKDMIKNHVGLHEEQISEIVKLVKGKSESDSNDSRFNSRRSFNVFDRLSDSGTEMWGRLSVRSNRGEEGVEEEVEQEVKEGSRRRGAENCSERPSSLLQEAVNSFLQRKKRPNPLTFVKNVLLKTGSSDSGRGDTTVYDYVQHRAYRNAKAMSKDSDIIEALVGGYLYISQRYVESAMQQIPHFIESNNILMEQCREHRRAFHDDKAAMTEVMRELEPCRQQLRGYGLLYMEDLNADLVFFDVDHRKSSIDLQQHNFWVSERPVDSGFEDSGNSRTKFRGYWTHYRNGMIKVNDKPMDVTVRTYTINMEINLQYTEIVALRCLQNDYLAPFFGMTRISNKENPKEKYSAIIFEGSLMSARLFQNNKMIKKRKFVKTVITGVVNGLEFLHQQNMVHLELNLDTVMVSFHTGMVQLCQMCCPRIAHLPDNEDIPTRTIVCLSPPVLDGHEYTIADDIYAFALLLWELVYPNNLPFAEQRKWPLSKFKKEVNLTKMLGPDVEYLNECYPNQNSVVIKTLESVLLVGARKISMDMTKIKSILGEICRDPAIRNIRQMRPPPIRKGSRSRSGETETLSSELSSFESLPRGRPQSSLSLESEDDAFERRPVAPPRPKHNLIQKKKSTEFLEAMERAPLTLTRSASDNSMPRVSSNNSTSLRCDHSNFHKTDDDIDGVANDVQLRKKPEFQIGQYLNDDTKHDAIKPIKLSHNTHSDATSSRSLGYVNTDSKMQVNNCQNEHLRKQRNFSVPNIQLNGQNVNHDPPRQRKISLPNLIPGFYTVIRTTSPMIIGSSPVEKKKKNRKKKHVTVSKTPVDEEGHVSTFYSGLNYKPMYTSTPEGLNNSQGKKKGLISKVMNGLRRKSREKSPSAGSLRSVTSADTYRSSSSSGISDEFSSGERSKSLQHDSSYFNGQMPYMYDTPSSLGSSQNQSHSPCMSRPRSFSDLNVDRNAMENSFDSRSSFQSSITELNLVSDSLRKSSMCSSCSEQSESGSYAYLPNDISQDLDNKDGDNAADFLNDSIRFNHQSVNDMSSNRSELVLDIDVDCALPIGNNFIPSPSSPEEATNIPDNCPWPGNSQRVDKTANTPKIPNSNRSSLRERIIPSLRDIREDSRENDSFDNCSQKSGSEGFRSRSNTLSQSDSQFEINFNDNDFTNSAIPTFSLETCEEDVSDHQDTATKSMSMDSIGRGMPSLSFESLTFSRKSRFDSMIGLTEEDEETVSASRR